MTKIIPKIIEAGVNFRWNGELKYQRALRKQPIGEIKKIQWDRLKKLLEFAYDNNTFYRDYFESVNLTPDDILQPSDLLLLPTTEKRTFKTHFEKILSNGADPNQHVLSCTSGSSGEPFKFYNEREMVKKTLYFSYLLNKESMGIQPYEKLNELEIKPNPRNEIDIDTLKKNGKQLGQKFKDIFLSEICGLKCDDVAYNNIDSICKLIKKYKIKGVYGYSTSVLDLAKYIEESKKFVKLRYVICIGGGLLKQQKELISKVFRCPVFMDYGSSECPRMGFECTNHNGYHFDIYNYFFEFVRDGKHIDGDGNAEIIVTNLNNYIFPFIRYKIGDIAELGTKRQCGCENNLPIIKNVQGRVHAAIIAPNGKEIPNGLFAVYLEYYYESIYQYQVIQTRKDEITLKIIPSKQIDENSLNNIKNWILDLCDDSMEVKIVLTDRIPLEKNGKKLDMIPYEKYLEQKKQQNDNENVDK